MDALSERPESLLVLGHATLRGYEYGLKAAALEETHQQCSQEHHCGLNSEPGQVSLVLSFCFMFLICVPDTTVLRMAENVARLGQ